eukprot:g17210.t1
MAIDAVHLEFHSACSSGQDCLLILDLLLRYGANLEALDDARSTPFATAAFNFHKSAMRLLTSRGANLMPVARDKVTPPKFACIMRNDDKVQLLLELGSGVGGSRNAVLTKEGQTCLFQVMGYMWKSRRRPTSCGRAYKEGRPARAGAPNGVVCLPLTWATACARPLMRLQAGELETEADERFRIPMQSVGSYVPSLPPAPEEVVKRGAAAVRHALLRSRAFRAASFLWPASRPEGGEGRASSAHPGSAALRWAWAPRGVVGDVEELS